MGKFDGVLLASDYDDTLLGSGPAVSEGNKLAIRYFIREGGHFCVATGRAYRAFARAAADVPMNAPAVLSNGSSIYDFQTGRLVYETHLPPESLERLEELVRVFPELGFEAYHGEDIYAFNPNDVTRMHMNKVGADYTVCPPREMPRPWTKVIFEQGHDCLAAVRDYVLEHWGADYECIFSNAVLLELTNKGSHKGSMVQRIAADLGISPQHIYCVGDNENDLPMLKISAIPFAPANCYSGLRDWGARIVGSCDQDCVAEIIGILDTMY